MLKADLIKIDKLVKSAGLIKVWNGSNWVDLRDEMSLVISACMDLIDELEDIKVLTSQLTDENENLKKLLFSEE